MTQWAVQICAPLPTEVAMERVWAVTPCVPARLPELHMRPVDPPSLPPCDLCSGSVPTPHTMPTCCREAHRKACPGSQAPPSVNSPCWGWEGIGIGRGLARALAWPPGHICP